MHVPQVAGLASWRMTRRRAPRMVGSGAHAAAIANRPLVGGHFVTMYQDAAFGALSKAILLLEETVNPARPVADIMTREVAVLHEEDNVEHILQQMHELKLRHVPVVDGRRLVGLVSHHDILRFTVSQLLVDIAGPRTREEYLEQLEENTFVASVMTRDPVSVTPQTPIAEAAERMFRANIGCLPVVEKGQLVGILTETDFLGLLVRLLKDGTET